MKVIKIYHKKSGVSIKSSVYIKESGHYAPYEVVHQYIRDNPGVKFEISPNKKLPPKRMEEGYYLLLILKVMEKKQGDITLLNRIIRNGGMVNYLKKLSTLKHASP